MRKISAILFTILICTASGQEFTIARVHYSGGGDWYSDPSSLPNLLNYVSSATNMKTAAEARVKLTDKELTDYPYLYLTGHGNLRFSDEEAIRLRQFLLSGAFLHVDDNYGFDVSFCRMNILFFLLTFHFPRVCRKSMSMTANHPRHTLFSMGIESCCCTHTNPIWAMDGKIPKSTTILGPYVRLH